MFISVMIFSGGFSVYEGGKYNSGSVRA
jgi:hypothetical protein